MTEENSTHETKKGKKKEAIGLKGFTLPEVESLKTATDQFIEKSIADVCTILVSEKIFTRARAFKTTNLKKGQNSRAILHSLIRTYQKREFKKGAWSYAGTILKVENGNYNEHEQAACEPGLNQDESATMREKFFKQDDFDGDLEQQKAKGQKEREKRIALLRAQAEKMRN